MLPSARLERKDSNIDSNENNWFFGPLDDKDENRWNNPTPDDEQPQASDNSKGKLNGGENSPINGMYIRIPPQKDDEEKSNDNDYRRISTGGLSCVSSASNLDNINNNAAPPRESYVSNPPPQVDLAPPKFISLGGGDGADKGGGSIGLPQTPSRLDPNYNGNRDSYLNQHDLLYEGQNYLAMSMLIYMFAQLREMAILGYTHSDFRTIDVNSTHPWTPPPPTQSEQEASGKRRVFRRMAISMKYLNYQVTPPTVSPDEELDGQRRFPRRGAMRYVPPPPSYTQNTNKNKEAPPPAPHPATTEMPLPQEDDDVSVQYSVSGMSACSYGKNVEMTNYLLNTMSAAKMIRVVLDELESEKNKEGQANQESYDKMGFQEHDVSMIKQFQRWVEDSRKTQLDDAAVQAIKVLRKKVERKNRRTTRRGSIIQRLSSTLSLSGVGNRDKEDDSVATSVNDVDNIRQSIEARRKSILGHSSYDDDKGTTWFSLQRTLIADHFGLKKDTDMIPSVITFAENDTAAQKSRRMSTEHISQDIINDVIDSSLSSYFQEGSVVSQMLRSGIEVAWFGDRHPKEAIYCLCVNRATKTVTVVFRGSVTAHNWVRNLQIVMTDHQNPIWEENYDGWDNMISLHTGFSLYLLRRRKIDGSRKLDEIFTRVDSIGNELSKDGNYRVCVTGHSLGGALATIFSFYAAADERFTKIGPVRVFTFASPRVGDLKFLYAYQQLERTGRLLHARFANTCDIVPLVPTFSLEGFLIGQWYKHVGLHISLHGCGGVGNYLTRRASMFSYTNDNGWWGFIKTAWRANFISNLTTIKNYAKNHRPNEHQLRLNFARQIRVSLAERGIRKLYTLEEYYRRKANFTSDFGDTSAERSLNMFSQNTVLFFIYAVILVFVLFCVFSLLVITPDITIKGNVTESPNPLGIQEAPTKVGNTQKPVEISGVHLLDEDQIGKVTDNETGKSQCLGSDQNCGGSKSETSDITEILVDEPKIAFTSIGQWAHAEDVEWNASIDFNTDFMAFVKARSSEMNAAFRNKEEVTQNSIQKVSFKDVAHTNALQAIRNARAALKASKKTK